MFRRLQGDAATKTFETEQSGVEKVADTLKDLNERRESESGTELEELSFSYIYRPSTPSVREHKE